MITITYLTGLRRGDVLNLLFPDRHSVPRGRAPHSLDWYHRANLLERTEASILVTIYQRLRDAGFEPTEALVGAYGPYQRVCQARNRISFDRAFDLVAYTEGRWLIEEKTFSLLICPVCQCEFLAAIGSTALSNDHCPFCKLVCRYRADPRVQASFPALPLIAPTMKQLGMFALMKRPGGEDQAPKP